MYPEKLSSVVADTENGSFPATNLEDSLPSRPWKSGGANTALLTATVAANADQLALYKTNAIGADIDIKVGGVSQETFSVDLTDPHVHNRLWQTYTEQTVEHTIEISLTGPAATAVYAGSLKAAKGVTFNNPAYDLKEGRRWDHHFIEKLNNGGYRTVRKPPLRQFNITFRSVRSTAYYQWAEIVDYYGPEPISMLLAENIDDHEWAILGHLLQGWDAAHDTPTYAKPTFSLTEVK
jgi:hypothetical protein